jgi:hypothetical protein
MRRRDINQFNQRSGDEEDTMMTLHKSQTTNDVLEEKRRRAEREQAPAVENERLQVLVGELLKENQNLRFKVAQLEQKAESAERGLADATRWAGMMV